jgi:3-oxoacyl-[acyl-carrier protein] reductase
MSIQFSFTNKKIVVTGGAQGIGFEIAKNFLISGAQVCLWDYNQETLKMAESELSSYSDRLSTYKVDVTDMSNCLAAAADNGTTDILINNAGITRDKSFAKMTQDDFKAVIDTNLTGLFNVTKSFLDQGLFNQNSKNNRIINMSSVVALYGNFGQTNYVAAKAGVIGLTKTWAKELGRKGFTCNAIAPGFISTKMTQAMPPDVLKSMAEKVPVQRMGEVQDISKACMFLSSDEAAYINGIVLSVDGGLTL